SGDRACSPTGHTAGCRRGSIKRGGFSMKAPGCNVCNARDTLGISAIQCRTGFLHRSEGEMDMAERDFDYIVIGSGAGGGPLAANLAKAGFKVMLMEAGGDSCLESGDRGRWMYEVPIFHGASTEYDECAWDFYVRHYSDDAQQARDSKKKMIDGKPYIWY